MNRAAFVAAVSAAFAAISLPRPGSGYVAVEHTPAVLMGQETVPAWAQGLVDKLHVAFAETAKDKQFKGYVVPGALEGGWIMKYAERREWNDPETGQTWAQYDARLCGPVPVEALGFAIDPTRSFFQMSTVEMSTVDLSGDRPREGSSWFFPYTSYAARCLIEDEPAMIVAMESGAAWELQPEGASSLPWRDSPWREMKYLG